MSNLAQPQFDVLVIGGGPAGMAAAVRAAQCGVRVAIVDDNLTLGGQIWRGESEPQGAPGLAGVVRPGNSVRFKARSREEAKWQELFRAGNIAPFCGKRVFHQPEPGILLAEGADAVSELRYRNLILATGARERFLPFPGWTLPNVMGTGGLQAMVKSGLPIAGKRVVIAGTGPLLLAVAAYLRKKGAILPIICEQASWGRLAQFGMALFGRPGKVLQALQLKKEIFGVPFSANSWPLLADGQHKLKQVTISRNGKSENIPCDYLACGFHLVPNVELPQLLGCRISSGYVQVDEFQQTTVPGVYCAGEPTGIGGVELSRVEGEIAGFAAAGCAADAQKLSAERERSRRFARLLDRTFRLRTELKSLPSQETLVCRCEDVPYSQLKVHASWRAAKLHTRCGMGPCQGRICGAATQFLFKWNPDSVRPPIFPARVESMSASLSSPQLERIAVSGGPQ